MERPYSSAPAGEAWEGEILARLEEVQEKLEKAAALAGRKREEITLMAVTKTVPPERVNLVIRQGVTLLGENRAQELVEKYDSYEKEQVGIHFIGHLQTNKVRQVIEKVEMIDSVDSLHLAEEIDRLALARLGKPMDVLMEVNIGEEESKSGVSYHRARGLLEEMASLGGIRVRGLMCIPPICEKTSILEGYFEKMHQLFVDIGRESMDNVFMDFLSMGMSGDYPYAVKHGANIVRIGSGLFGKRNVV